MLAFLDGNGDSSPNTRSRAAIHKVFIAQGTHSDKRLDKIRDFARAKKIPVVDCDRKKLDRLMPEGVRHQGVVAQISAGDFISFEHFLSELKKEQESRQENGKTMDGYAIAVLDGIEDPHNLGAIIRVAEVSGVKAILVPFRRSAGLTASVARASAGAIAYMPMVRVTNIVQSLEKLKEVGFWVVGLALENSQTIYSVDLKRPTVVVIGSEDKGIGRLVAEHCDFLARIPMFGRTESLNASVAAGVAFYEIVRQNGELKGPATDKK